LIRLELHFQVESCVILLTSLLFSFGFAQASARVNVPLN
jgi:hypothetical protein